MLDWLHKPDTNASRQFHGGDLPSIGLCADTNAQPSKILNRLRQSMPLPVFNGISQSSGEGALLDLAYDIWYLHWAQLYYPEAWQVRELRELQFAHVSFMCAAALASARCYPLLAHCIL